MRKFWYWVQLFCISMMVILVATLQLHNITRYPITRGFDARAHLEYRDFLRIHQHLPRLDAGWEMHQAPLYYVVISLLPTSISPQWLGFAWWILIAFAVATLLDKKAVTIGFGAKVGIFLHVVSLPVLVYLTPAVTNELFSTALLSLTLVWYCCFWVPTIRTRSKKASIVFGLLLALALLSKATSLILVLALCGERLITNGKNIRLSATQLALPFLIAGVLGGWFYVRNSLVYGSPTYQAANYIPLSSYAQPIVARDSRFFFSPHAFFSPNLFISHYTSFPAGTFFSWYYDGHGVLLPVQPYTKLGNIVCLLGAGWFFIALVGVGRLLYLSLSENTKIKSISFASTEIRSLLLLPVYSFLLLSAYVYYNFQLPFYSTVKASFLSSLAIPYTACLLFSVEWIKSKFPRLWRSWFQWAVVLFAAATVLAVVRHFWIYSWWYSAP